MKLILYQATMAITEIDFVPGPFRCQIEQQHLDFAVAMGSAQKPGVFRLARISRVNPPKDLKVHTGPRITHVGYLGNTRDK